MGQTVAEAFFYALHLEQQTNRIQAGLLDELDRALQNQQTLLDSIPDPLSYSPQVGEKDPFVRHESFVGMAGRHGLRHYVKYKISEFGLLACESQALPLLFSFLKAPFKGHFETGPILTEPHPPSARLVKLLLDSGADPNVSWHGLTAWAYACITFCNLWFHPRGGDRGNYADIMAAMVVAGADPNVLIRHDYTRVLLPISMIL
jgi:hypothetical protein